MKEKKSEKIKSPAEPVSIVETSQFDEETNNALVVTPDEPATAQDATVHEPGNEKSKGRLNYWSIIEFLLAFATPFFMETLIIWSLEAMFPYHRPHFSVLTPITTVFLIVSATRIVPPIVGLVFAILLSKRMFKGPKFVLFLWFALTTAFILAWVLYCRTINTYWL